MQALDEATATGRQKFGSTRDDTHRSESSDRTNFKRI